MDHHLPRLTLGKMQNPVRGILHGGAAVASIVGAVVLWLRGPEDPSRQLSLLIFALSLVALYTVSSLYHSVPWKQIWKKRMQRLDHSMIYMVVAGTYTPFAFVLLDGGSRWDALAVVWGIAVVGIAQKVFFPRIRNWFSITLQTVQGWMAIFLLAPLADRLPEPAVALTVVGGALYTVGLVFLLTRRPRLWPKIFSYHEAFHVCVVAGSAAHYAVTLLYVAPFPL